MAWCLIKKRDRLTIYLFHCGNWSVLPSRGTKEPYSVICSSNAKCLQMKPFVQVGSKLHEHCSVYQIKAHVGVDYIALLLWIQLVLASNLDPETGYYDLSCTCFSSSHPRKCRVVSQIIIGSLLQRPSQCITHKWPYLSTLCSLTYWLTHSLTHSLMELSPSWEAANCATTQ
jgi:hypothetical protein